MSDYFSEKRSYPTSNSNSISNNVFQEIGMNKEEFDYVQNVFSGLKVPNYKELYYLYVWYESGGKQRRVTSISGLELSILDWFDIDIAEDVAAYPTDSFVALKEGIFLIDKERNLQIGDWVNEVHPFQLKTLDWKGEK